MRLKRKKQRHRLFSLKYSCSNAWSQHSTAGIQFAGIFQFCSVLWQIWWCFLRIHQLLLFWIRLKIYVYMFFTCMYPVKFKLTHSSYRADLFGRCLCVFVLWIEFGLCHAKRTFWKFNLIPGSCSRYMLQAKSFWTNAPKSFAHRVLILVVVDKIRCNKLWSNKL